MVVAACVGGLFPMVVTVELNDYSCNWAVRARAGTGGGFYSFVSYRCAVVRCRATFATSRCRHLCIRVTGCCSTLCIRFNENPAH